jgi:hypothetical protein
VFRNVNFEIHQSKRKEKSTIFSNLRFVWQMEKFIRLYSTATLLREEFAGNRMFAISDRQPTKNASSI